MISPSGPHFRDLWTDPARAGFPRTDRGSFCFEGLPSRFPVVDERWLTAASVSIERFHGSRWPLRRTRLVGILNGALVLSYHLGRAAISAESATEMILPHILCEALADPT